MNLSQAARVGETRIVLAQLGFPLAQTNERSALVLLCLLDLPADQAWAAASNDSLWRIHPLMQWLRDHYDKDYAPNSRETIRRQTLHQFVDAGLVSYNPDNPERPVNSSANCYQVTSPALELLRTHDAAGFAERMTAYKATAPGLTAQYAQHRGMAQIPLTLADGTEVALTAGGQNILIKHMIEQFCPRWTPGGHILYIGDAGKDAPIFDVNGFAEIGVTLDKRGKLPDLIVYLPGRNWLILMEAASTHGPVDGKRHGELATLFDGSTAGLVYVSCFPSRAVMRRFLAEISWETEVWCAEDPEHLIHFDGERFLGPYEKA
ncbi:MAG: restriction endonuclease [Actinomycetota bacterium]|nr:restriction endonuclease [Actinomycetota bacterium]